MFSPSILEAESPEYRRLRSEYRELDLEINHLAHNREIPRIENEDERREKLWSLKIERQKLSNKLGQLKSTLERTIMLRNAVHNIRKVQTRRKVMKRNSKKD